jgi:hypothetical protein
MALDAGGEAPLKVVDLAVGGGHGLRARRPTRAIPGGGLGMSMVVTAS